MAQVILLDTLLWRNAADQGGGWPGGPAASPPRYRGLRRKGGCPAPQPLLRVTAAGVTLLFPLQDAVTMPELPRPPETQGRKAGPLRMGPLRPLQ